MLKYPSKSVTTPLLVPFIIIETPGIGLLEKSATKPLKPIGILAKLVLLIA